MKKPRLSFDPNFLLPLFLLFSKSPPADALLFLGAVFLHEAGHLVALLSFGSPLRQLRFSLAGASLEILDPYLPYKKEAMVYLAGPIAGLGGCVISFFLLRWHFTRGAMLFFSFNLLLALFNLLPLQGLDGGKALFALLCRRGEEEAARTSSRRIHLFTLTGLLILSLWVWEKEQNPSLFILTLTFLLEGRGKRKKATISS